MNKISGIYSITNIKNYDRYIGSSIDIYKRICTHKYLLVKNADSIYLQNAWNKYGKNNFIFEIVEVCNKKLLLTKEQYYIDNLNSKYNISKIAGRIEMNDYIKKKISKSCKGRFSPFKGKTHSMESKQKISLNHADMTGKNSPWYGGNIQRKMWKNPEFREKMSGRNHPLYGKNRPEHSKLMSGKNNPFYGKKHSIK